MKTTMWTIDGVEVFVIMCNRDELDELDSAVGRACQEFCVGVCDCHVLLDGLTPG